MLQVMWTPHNRRCAVMWFTIAQVFTCILLLLYRTGMHMGPIKVPNAAIGFNCNRVHRRAVFKWLKSLCIWLLQSYNYAYNYVHSCVYEYMCRHWCISCTYGHYAISQPTPLNRDPGAMYQVYNQLFRNYLTGLPNPCRTQHNCPTFSHSH